MTALRTLEVAVASGDLEPLAQAYARNAVLDASLPGARQRHHGRDEIVSELGRWWQGAAAGVVFDAQEWPAGAALWTERDGVRLRHYLHLSGDLIVRHWVYSAAPRAAFGGNSGASIERRGELIVKGVRPLDGWLSRATRDEHCRSARLWTDGVFARFPAAVDHCVVGVEQEEDGYRVLMRDVSHALLGDAGRLSREQTQAITRAAAALHAAFLDQDVPVAARLEDFLTVASPATAERERAEIDLPPKQLEAAWEAFAQASAPDVGQAVLGLLDDPAPLARALGRDGVTLIHGDLRDDNLGVDGPDVYLIDWDLAAMATPGVEMAWFLLQDAWRIDAAREDLVADAIAAEDGLLDERGLALGAVAGFMQYGWILGHSAIVHPDPAERAWAQEELGWWQPLVRAGLEEL